MPMPTEATTTTAPDTTPTASTPAASPAITETTATPAADAGATAAIPDGGETARPAAPTDDVAAFRAGAAKVSANPEAVAPATEAAPDPKPGEAIEVYRDAAGRFTSKDGKVLPDQAAAAAAAAKAEAKPEPKPDTPKGPIDVEAEVKDLGLKGKTEARFRELATEVKEAAPFRAELAKVGITKIEQLPDLISTAARAAEWERSVAATGASPEQFGATVQYTALAVRANQGDIPAAKAALAAASAEVAHWAKLLGVEGPGVDPLAEHADLAKEVADGDLTRARALEIASQRKQTALAETHARASDTQAGAQAAHQQAIADLTAFDAQLKASDPHYAAKLPALKPVLDVIRANLHPSKWAAAVREAYAKIPNPAPVAAAAPAAAPAVRAPITSMPVRPTGGTATPLVRVPKDDLEAFRLGVASVR